MNEFYLGDIVNDLEGNAGEIVGLLEDGIVEVEWENSMVTVETINELILV